MDTVPKSPVVAPATSAEIAAETVQPTTEVPHAVDVKVGGNSGAAEGTTSKGNIGTPETPQLVAKRGRGRPKGTGKLQTLASIGELLAKTSGEDFKPYVLIVHEGEDIAKKILLFNATFSGSSVVLAAVGPVRRVEVSKAEYEGDFDIIYISASHTIGSKGKIITVLSIELADTYGELFGGVVTGPVIAAGPIQVIMGGFIQEKKKKRKERGLSSLRPILEVDETANDETPEERIPEEVGVQPDNVSEPDTNENSEKLPTPSPSADDEKPIPSTNGEKTHAEEIAVDPISSAFQDQRLEAQDENLQDHCSGKLQD